MSTEHISSKVLILKDILKAGLKKDSYGGLYGQELDIGNLSFFPFINLMKKRIVGKYSTVHMVLSFDYEIMLCVHYSYIHWTYSSGFTNKLLERLWSYFENKC